MDFLRTETDVKGLAYEELVGANLRGDRGEFFTPRNIVRMTIEMLDIQIGEKILDPAPEIEDRFDNFSIILWE